LLARTKPLDYNTEMPLLMTRWNVADPNAPVALRPTEADVPGQRVLPAIFEDIGGTLTPVYDWRRVGPMLADARSLPRGFHFQADVAALDAALRSPDRVLLGQAQEDWFGRELSSSRAVWRVIGNQVLMAPIAAPDLSAIPVELSSRLEPLLPGVTQLLDMTRQPIPLTTDTWDGYPAARDRVLQQIRQHGPNTIVVTGDSHMAWANEISDATGRVAVELGGTSITSPSDAEYLAAAGIDFVAALKARNEDVKWAETGKRGFILLTLTRRQATAEYINVSSIRSKEFEVGKSATFTIAAEEGPGTAPLTPA